MSHYNPCTQHSLPCFHQSPQVTSSKTSTKLAMQHFPCVEPCWLSPKDYPCSLLPPLQFPLALEEIEPKVDKWTRVDGAFWSAGRSWGEGPVSVLGDYGSLCWPHAQPFIYLETYQIRGGVETKRFSSHWGHCLDTAGTGLPPGCTPDFYFIIWSIFSNANNYNQETCNCAVSRISSGISMNVQICSEN